MTDFALTAATEDTAFSPSTRDGIGARALALHNRTRTVTARSILLKFTGIGPFLIAATWLLWELAAAWDKSFEVAGPSAGLRLTVILLSPLLSVVNALGKHAVQVQEHRKAMLPRDLPITADALRHLSLVGTTVMVEVDGQTEAVEFVRTGDEVRVRWADHEACLWIASAHDVNGILEQSSSALATDVIRRKGCIEVIAGPTTSHVSDLGLGNILGELDLKESDILSQEIESTSIASNAGHTVRFEYLS